MADARRDPRRVHAASTRRRSAHEMDEEVEIVSVRATLRTPLPAARGGARARPRSATAAGESTIDAYSFTRGELARRSRSSSAAQLEPDSVSPARRSSLEETATTYLDAGFDGARRTRPARSSSPTRRRRDAHAPSRSSTAPARAARAAQSTPIRSRPRSIRHGLNSAANQMKRALVRTAFSPVIYEVLDFAVAIYDRQIAAARAGAEPAAVHGHDELLRRGRRRGGRRRGGARAGRHHPLQLPVRDRLAPAGRRCGRCRSSCTTRS